MYFVTLGQGFKQQFTAAYLSVIRWPMFAMTPDLVTTPPPPLRARTGDGGIGSVATLHDRPSYIHGASTLLCHLPIHPLSSRHDEGYARARSAPGREQRSSLRSLWWRSLPAHVDLWELAPTWINSNWHPPPSSGPLEVGSQLGPVWYGGTPINSLDFFTQIRTYSYKIYKMNYKLKVWIPANFSGKLTTNHLLLIILSYPKQNFNLMAAGSKERERDPPF